MATTTTIPRLKERFRSELVPRLQSELSLGNVMQVPKPLKVTINMGVGEAVKDAKLIEGAVKDMTTIAGQKPLVTKARKSIANFKLREGMAIGCCVTLRGRRMYEFLDRLMNLALPRVRDFRGANPRGFDGRGNYTLGVRDQLIFPEVNYAKVQKVKGMNVCIVTTARTDEEARALLAGLGMPFRKN